MGADFGTHLGDVSWSLVAHCGDDIECPRDADRQIRAVWERAVVLGLVGLVRAAEAAVDGAMT